MDYDVPILSDAHARFCKQEAERRYQGKLVIDEYGMLLVEDAALQRHTDTVLRALSHYLKGSSKHAF